MADNGMKGKDDDDKKGGILNMSARIFVANVPSEKVTQKELHDRFSKYGRVNDVYMGKTFAFVQFANANDADAAIKSETGTFIGDNRIDCSLAKKQPRSQRPGENPGKPDSGGYSRGGPSPYGSLPPRGRERSPLRGYEDRFDPRRYDDLDRYPPPRDYRDDPYRRDDPYFRDLAERDALFLSELVEDKEDGLPKRPPPPRTPEYIRDMERRYEVHRRQIQDNEAYHLERMKLLKEEHELKIEVLNLEKQALSLKIAKYMQYGDENSFQNVSENVGTIPSSLMGSTPYSYDTTMTSSAPPMFGTSVGMSALSRPAGIQRGPMVPGRSAATTANVMSAGMKAGVFGRNPRL